MNTFIILSAILVCVASAPEYISYNTYVPLAKSTLTSSSQSVDHGSTHVVHAPVVPLSTHTVDTHILSPVYHMPVTANVKSTLTNSNQIVNHGSTSLVHAPLVHVQHAPVLYSSPYVAYKTPDSAVSHHSSTVHETLPLYSLHR